MRLVFKILGILFALLFAWAAYVQNNDPDARMWYLIYGIAAFASILFVVNRLSFGIALVLFVLALIGAYVLWPVKFEGFTIGEGDIENIERGREAWGLIIIAVVMLVYTLRIRAVKRALKV